MKNVKKERKTIEWERLEISSRALEIPSMNFMQGWHNKGQKWYGPIRSRRDKEEVARILISVKKKKKKGLNDPDNHDGVITHLEPDILKCEV